MKLIITADWHLREDVPLCRSHMSLEEWMDLQREAIQFVFKVAQERPGTKVAIVGDLFDRSHVHPSVVNMFLEEALCSGCVVHLLAGNHDLLYHQIKNLNRSSFGHIWNLMQSGGVDNLQTMDSLGKWFHFGTVQESDYSGEKFVFLHELCFKDEDSKHSKIKAYVAEDLLDMFPKAKYICLGDNHKSFLYTSKDARHVINPGCLVRQVADLINDAPGVFFIDTDVEDVEFISFSDGEVSNTHLTKEKERDDRIDAFVSSINSNEPESLDFRENLRKEMKSHEEELGAATQVIVELLEECNDSKH